MNIQEFIDDIKAQLVELQTDAASEHEQVMAAIAALQAAVASTVPDSAKAEVDALFAATKTSISGVYEPAP